LLQFISAGYGPAAAVAVAKTAGGGPARTAIAIAFGLLIGVPSPFVIHKVGRVAFKAGVHPLPMYVAAALFPSALGAMAAVVTHHVIIVLKPLR
jgi:hypothetical protein